MQEWQKHLSNSVVKVKDLPFLPDSIEYRERLQKVADIYPIRINSYFLNQIKSENDPMWKQVVPTLDELDDILEEESLLVSDPLNEEGDMPVPELVHRYPDRVLLMVNNQCPIICRFCTRKRKIGFPGIVTRETLRQGIEYIRSHPEIRDVILSGGDPLLVPDKELNRILSELRSIDHLEIIRIGTRVPGTLPQRVTPELCNILKKYHPLYFNMHFNHPDEITPEVENACSMLADAGIPLGSQTVLLKGVNDNSKTISEKLSLLSAEKILENIDYILEDKLEFKEQNHQEATHAPKIKKLEGKINWNDSAENINGKINGLYPSPGAWFIYKGERYKILKGEIGSGLGKIGEVVNDYLEINCNNKKTIKVLEIQREGKRPQNINEFMLGSQIKKGLNLNNE